MDTTPVAKLVEQQEWPEPLGMQSDEILNNTLDLAGSAADAAKDVLINSRLLGHKWHPTITDVPFGSWTTTPVADGLELAGNASAAPAGDLSLLVGLGASALAAAGGLADLSETAGSTDRKLGMVHGILHGATMLLYGASWAARRSGHRGAGRALSFSGYAGLLGAAYLAHELHKRRENAS